MVGGVGTAPTVFSWPDEEDESDPGQISYYLLAVGAALIDGVQGLQDRDRDGADSRRWRILFGVCGELMDQPKVEIDQLVVPGVVFPHG